MAVFWQPRFEIEKVAEQAKRTLSSKSAADVHLKSGDGTVLQATVKRTDFEQGCDSLFDRIPTVPLQILREKNLEPSDVNILLAVGGSSYMPRVQELLRQHFPDTDMPEANASFDPELAVVHGAALCAERLISDPSSLPMDVIPLSLGVPEMQPVEQYVVEERSASGLELSVFPEYSSTDEHTHACDVGIRVRPPASNAPAADLASVYVSILIDVSGSMIDLDASGRTKIDSVKLALVNVINKARPSVTFHFCTFSNRACEHELQPMSMDDAGKKVAAQFVEQLRLVGSTNMAAGIRASAQNLREQINLQRATMILLTDGRPNSPPEASRELQLAVSSFKNTGTSLSVYTFGFGIPGDSNSLDGPLLEGMARQGGGFYHYIRDGDAAEGVFAEILGDAQKARGGDTIPLAGWANSWLRTFHYS